MFAVYAMESEGSLTDYDASIIIPTYNREKSLRIALQALERQTWPNDRFQVLVVDDGSTDETATVAESHFPFPFRLIRQPNRGSAAARNLAARLSTGQLLIFIDDDIVVEPEYVEGLIEEHHAHENVIGMATCFTISEPQETHFSRIYPEMINPSSVEPQGAFASFTECVTNNLSVEREAFFSLGKMQDVAGDGPTWWGDIDFGFRAFKAGFRFRRSGKAICRHYDYSFSSLPVFSQRIRRASEVSIHLLQKYPEVLPHLPMLTDKTPVSIKDDSPALIAHKVWHSITARGPVINMMQGLVRLLEDRHPNPAILRPLYRWILSGYIYQGFHQGLSQYKPASRAA